MFVGQVKYLQDQKIPSVEDILPELKQQALYSPIYWRHIIFLPVR